MAQEFAHQWSQNFEEPAPKRLRLDSVYHQSLAEVHVPFPHLEPNHQFYDSVVNEGPYSLGSFDGSWTGFLEDSQSNTTLLRGDLCWNIDPYSNPGHYGETLYPLSSKPKPEVVQPIHSYGQFTSTAVNDESEVSQAARGISEEIFAENQICFGMVRES